ncbi:hypothetical protein FB565_008961 [Actinoplanes lutulentus]|uniref:Uncharacterized protein n=1 Tax=Actinoplanes lutulentus TaxID=1287878 RepID=A0A327Z5J2_9ACTN|nr:hypothetical protein [Actinoplanes lutulentus]MBB2949156.1 hypothetical protein [Actinoplanes lutulentus]RAK31477.1 hypothetical protein B0I29_115284 [Actinoplanes lutulentus]
MLAHGEQAGLSRASYQCRLLTGAEEIAAAQRLQGQAYVRHGHLAAEALTSDGWLPWHDQVEAGRVRWFGVHDADGLLAVAKKIVSLTAAAPVGDGLVEVSGVAKADRADLAATLHVYRAIYQDSVRRAERMWVMSVIPALRATLERVAPGGISFGQRVVRVADVHPQVRPEVVVYPAWGLVDGFTARIRASADRESDAPRRQFLHGVADFMDDGIGG